MAEIKYLGKDSLIYLWALLKPRIDGKVSKVDGKGLSTNDLTNELKALYDAAQPNVIEGVKVNGVQLTPASKIVDISMLTTQQINDLISEAIESVVGLSFEIVPTLPATGEGNKIYLVLKGDTTQNIYTEFIWANGAWEKIGDTSIDLSGYVLETDLVAITNAEIDTILGM